MFYHNSNNDKGRSNAEEILILLVWNLRVLQVFEDHLLNVCFSISWSFYLNGFTRLLVVYLKFFLSILFSFLTPSSKKLLSFAIATDKFARITSLRDWKRGDFNSDKEVARLAGFLYLGREREASFEASSNLR